MGISKEQLGIDTESTKVYIASEISKISHTSILNRESPDSHPMSAITGLNDIADKINDINIAQKTINKSLDYCFASISKQSPPGRENIDISSKLNDVIKFTPYINNNIAYNQTTGMYTLKAGKTYAIEASIGLYAPAGKWIYVNIWDNTNSKYLGNDCLTGLETSVAQVTFPTKCMVKPTTDIDVCIKINHSTSDTVTTSISYLTIQEIGKDTVIDPVNYVNTTQGIEDAPVGNTITVIGDIAPKHYIIYDNTELSIAQYPYLADCIKTEFGSYNFFGGDGINTFCVSDKPLQTELTNVTPIMTSNTTPSPYVVTGSDVSTASPTDPQPFKAFDRRIDTFFLTSLTSNGWIQLDFGRKQSVSNFSLQYNTSPTNTHMPKDFTLYGSNDANNYTLIKSFTNQTNWGSSEERVYSLDATVNYRYYKLTVEHNNGHVQFTVIPELKFLLNKRMESKYIKYEPTYYMSIAGLIEEKSLWEGSKLCPCANDKYTTIEQDLTLADNIYNYDKIVFYYSWHQTSTGNNSYFESKEFDTSAIVRANNISYDKIVLDINYAFQMTIDIILLTDNSIRLNKTFSTAMSQTSGDAIRISKIIGIKYKTFQS